MSMETADRQLIASDGQQLCLACGLCCAGVWFSHVILDPLETELALQAGLQLDHDCTEPRSHQPCALHRRGQCSAYEGWRPAACVGFSCAVLDNLLAGRYTFDQALTHVAAARALAERVRTDTGATRGGLCGPQFLGSLDCDTSRADPERPVSFSAATQLDAVALTMYYSRYFGKAAPEAGAKGGSASGGEA